MNELKNERRVIGLILTLIIVSSASLSYALYREKSLSDRIDYAQAQMDTTTKDLESKMSDLSDQIGLIINDNTSLTAQLQNQQNQASDVQAQIGQIYSAADTLTKLSKTDPQLLAKYSKVYFLNENYIPAALSTIDSKYTYEPDRKYQFLTNAYPFLQDLLSDSKGQGVHLEIISSYRSFGTQAALKSSYTVTYGAGTANSFSADQGYSEHQLGTAIDFTTPTVAATFTGFDQTPEYQWLQNNAYKYGFILSYPQNNSYYEYEPWHWRFVGIDLATRLHTDGKHFYDLDQRTINEYLSVIFNQI